MGMRKVNIIYVVCVLLCCLGLPACKKNIGLTTVSVADSVRHYYPLIAGQVLNLSYEIENGRPASYHTRHTVFLRVYRSAFKARRTYGFAREKSPSEIQV